MKNTGKKDLVQPDMFKEHFPANKGLIRCWSTHQEVPKIYNNISGFISAGI